MTYPGLKPLLLLSLLVLILTHVSAVYALSGDRQQPIHIDADRMVAEKSKGFSHYIGNVHITQGSLKIDADEVYIYLVDGLLNKLIIIGSPAKLQQIPDNSAEVVYSQALRMEYFASTDQLFLMKEAEVWQGGSRFSGEHIEYDTRNSRISANSEGKKSGRVRAVIVPKNTATNNAATKQSTALPSALWPPIPPRQPAASVQLTHFWQSAPLWQPTPPWQSELPEQPAAADETP
ncbi:MAG: lipopolysaccharide transport periplasmic protein LptA [Gammaproteobacteria bacterium]|nr:lipopolysaccharide transport periplasmic protein LptA [Gammaproteobacteria bacterium]